MSWGTSFDKIEWPTEALNKLLELEPILPITAEEMAQGQAIRQVEWVPNVGIVIKAIKERNNLVPTHDPYTNPNAHIYYSCGCGAILDPGIKSFAALNNHASEAGWKIRWGHEHYTAYCVECGKGVE